MRLWFLYVAFNLSLHVHLSSWCLGEAVCRDCDVPWVSTLIFLNGILYYSRDILIKSVYRLMLTISNRRTCQVSFFNDRGKTGVKVIYSHHFFNPWEYLIIYRIQIDIDKIYNDRG